MFGGSVSVFLPNGATATRAGNDLLSHVLRKVITNAAGEPSSYTFAVTNNTEQDNICVILVQVRGADTTTPELSVATPTTGANDFTTDNANPSSMGVSGDLVLIFHAASGNTGTLGSKTGGAPSGYSLVGAAVKETTGTTYELLIEVASANGGSSAPGVWTGTATTPPVSGTLTHSSSRRVAPVRPPARNRPRRPALPPAPRGVRVQGAKVDPLEVIKLKLD